MRAMASPRRDVIRVTPRDESLMPLDDDYIFIPHAATFRRSPKTFRAMTRHDFKINERRKHFHARQRSVAQVEYLRQSGIMPK